MAKRKISLIGLVVVMICVLVFAPVVTAGIYFIHTVSGQLQHTASETVSMYLNEFTDRTDRMMSRISAAHSRSAIRSTPMWSAPST